MQSPLIFVMPKRPCRLSRFLEVDMPDCSAMLHGMQGFNSVPPDNAALRARIPGTNGVEDGEIGLERMRSCEAPSWR